MALFRSENNVASHKVSGLVSKQENPSQAGESQTEIWYNLILFPGGPKFTQIHAMQIFPLFSPAGENMYPP